MSIDYRLALAFSRNATPIVIGTAAIPTINTTLQMKVESKTVLVVVVSVVVVLVVVDSDE